MIRIPAICPNGHIFPSGFALGPGGAASVKNVTSGPCPKCGQMGIIPDGLHTFLNDSIKFFADSSISTESLRRLKNIFSEAQTQSIDITELKSKIEKQTPELTGFAQYLPTKKELVSGTIFILLEIILFIVINNIVSGKENPEVIIQEIYNNQTIINNRK